MYAQFGSTLAQTWLSIGRGDTASEAHKECESISSSFLVCVCPPAVLDSFAVLTFAFASLFFSCWWQKWPEAERFCARAHLHNKPGFGERGFG